MSDLTAYAICWDLENPDIFLENLFEEFKKIGPKLIYKNLYDYHLVEYAPIDVNKVKAQYKSLYKIRRLKWFIYSYEIYDSPNPKVVLKLFIGLSSYLRLILCGKLRSPIYTLTIASVDTSIQDLLKYKLLIKTFIKKNRFKILESKNLSFIQYVTNKWERRVSI
tara:strand:+ start:383 stop:877 length:495 start_codon:yes stop_codon:yes gene_type:complete